MTTNHALALPLKKQNDKIANIKIVDSYIIHRERLREKKTSGLIVMVSLFPVEYCELRVYIFR